MRKHVILIIMLTLFVYSSVCYAEEKAPPQSSINNCYYAKLMAENYVSLLKTKYKDDTTNDLYQEAKFKYKIAYAKFTVWNSLLTLTSNAKKDISTNDNTQLAWLAYDALCAYSDFIRSAKTALNKPFYSQSSVDPIASGNFSARTITKLTFIEKASIAGTVLEDFTIIENIVKNIIQQTLPPGTDCSKLIENSNKALETYKNEKGFKISILKDWLKKECLWTPWEDIPLITQENRVA